MTRLKEFSENVMLLYGMDGDPDWENIHARFLAEVHPNYKLQVKYSIADKKDAGNKEYGILSIDIEIRTIENQKLVILSRRNLYRIKK
jgi:hypothetical protein